MERLVFIASYKSSKETITEIQILAWGTPLVLKEMLVIKFIDMEKSMNNTKLSKSRKHRYLVK